VWLFNIALGFMSHSETASAFNRDIVSDRRQLGLIGAAFLLTVLPTQLEFLQRMLDLTGLSGYDWLIALGLALALVLVDEVVKIFLRRRERPAETSPIRPAYAV
jgi:Ca2+-transporting ATPase